jgi:hypothetical protein
MSGVERGGELAHEREAHQETRIALVAALKERDSMESKLEAFLNGASALGARMIFIISIPMLLAAIDYQLVARLRPEPGAIVGLIAVSAAFAVAGIALGLTGRGPAGALRKRLRIGLEKAIELYLRGYSK